MYPNLFVPHTRLSAPLFNFHYANSTATLGNALTYVYPAIMYSSVVKKQNLKGEEVGVFIANLSAVLGLVMGAIGAKMALGK
jgi:hypothetical protein